MDILQLTILAKLNMWYNVNWSKLMHLLLPTFLRQSRMIAFLNLFAQQMTLIFNKWLLGKIQHEIWLAHNAQVCYLQKILNDEFPNPDRMIRITDGQLYQRMYIYTKNEKKPKWLGVMHIRQAIDYADVGYDFFVVVPKTLQLEEIKHKMNALIQRYKLASKRYTIIYDESN